VDTEKAQSFTIRDYSTTDFTDLCRLVAEFYTVHHRITGHGPMPVDEAALVIQDDMLGPDSHILVAEAADSGEIVGFCRYERHQGAFFGRELCVTENKRLRGAGTALLRAAEKRIKEAGEHNLFISVVARNPQALEFFAKRGYNILNTVELRTPFPDEPVTRKPIDLLGLRLRY
jgi:ribosomal protein S18 acetylase RimI-like enzyme